MPPSQAEYDEYQRRKAEVRDWGHDEIRKIHEGIARKIERLHEEFHAPFQPKEPDGLD